MRNGSQLLAPPELDRLEPGVPLRLDGLSWSDYLAISEEIGDQRLRTVYSEGEMEILMPTNIHEVWSSLLAKLIEAMAAELAMPIKSFGSSTFRAVDAEQAIEPDGCFYLTNVEKVRGKRVLDLSVDPPPDLAIEIEVSRSAKHRLPIYATLGVPEVWRFNGETLTMHRLSEAGKYDAIDRSVYFPQLTSQDFARFLCMDDEMLDNEIVAAFRAWMREQDKPA